MAGLISCSWWRFTTPLSVVNLWGENQRITIRQQVRRNACVDYFL
jgi:hypothetical protein